MFSPGCRRNHSEYFQFPLRCDGEGFPARGDRNCDDAREPDFDLSPENVIAAYCLSVALCPGCLRPSVSLGRPLVNIDFLSNNITIITSSATRCAAELRLNGWRALEGGVEGESMSRDGVGASGGAED